MNFLKRVALIAMMAASPVNADESETVDVIAWLDGCVALAKYDRFYAHMQIECFFNADRYLHFGRTDEEYLSALDALNALLIRQMVQFGPFPEAPESLNIFTRRRIERSHDEILEFQQTCLRGDVSCSTSEIQTRWIIFRESVRLSQLELRTLAQESAQ